jgi:hypothetical protein
MLSAGVKRYLPWQFGVDYDVIGRGSAQTLFDEQFDVRDLLRGQRGERGKRRKGLLLVQACLLVSF